MKAPLGSLFLITLTGLLPSLAQQTPSSSAPINLAELQAGAAKGDPDAEAKLGWLYGNGKDVPQDYQKAADLYRKAAAQGSAKAMFNLGYMYHHAQGMAEDDATAEEWYEKAAAAGMAQAQLVVGLGYYHGDMGKKQDYAAAAKWLTLAAAQTKFSEPSRMAANALGMQYENGWGVARDGKKAMALWEQAADGGDGKAKFNLGRAYLEGAVVTKDPVKGYMWLKLACYQNEMMAMHLFGEDLNAGEFTPEQRAEGDRLAAAYQKTHHTIPMVGPTPIAVEPGTVGLFKKPAAGVTNAPSVTPVAGSTPQ